MNTIPREKTNLGGIAKVWAIPSYLVDIRNQPKAPNSFTLPEGFKDYTHEITPVFESGKFSESVKPSPAGQMCEPLVSFSIAKDCESTSRFCMSLLIGPWAIMIQDQNGLFRMAGSKNYPVRGSLGKTTGVAITDLNNIHLEFTGPSPYPAIFIENPF